MPKDLNGWQGGRMAFEGGKSKTTVSMSTGKKEGMCLEGWFSVHREVKYTYRSESGPDDDEMGSHCRL